MSVADVPDTLRMKIVRYVRDHSGASISEMARRMGVPISNIRDKLNVAERRGHLTGQVNRALNPTGGPILVHQYKVTEAGLKWLELQEQ